jgi:hypothetical protein
MRVTRPLLTLSALLITAPAFAQGGGYYDPGGPYNQDRYNRYENYPQRQGQTWQGPMHQGPMHYGQPGQWQNYPQQSNSMQQGPYGGYPQTGPSQMGQRGESTSGPISFATQGQIKSSLETSGFKNVTVLPQSFLIRATAPDGSRILMQVSSDNLSGIVVPPTDQGGTSGGGTSSSTGNPGSTTGSASNIGGTSTGGTSTGGTSGTGGTSSAGGTTSGGGTSTGGTTGSTTSGTSGSR